MKFWEVESGKWKVKVESWKLKVNLKLQTKTNIKGESKNAKKWKVEKVWV